ncbi:MAG: M67 family metallopeptidase [Anaerolineae bacterium]|nr:M67 family metallopeptidase [Anaerolineae bacterium]
MEGKLTLVISNETLKLIHKHGENAYPDEGAGFLLGRDDGEVRHVEQIYSTENAREDGARHDRYLVSPEEYLKAEIMADKLGLSLIGVFHSHPDHPNRPSEFDREWAQPFFSYIITSVNQEVALESRSWRLTADRSKFEEELITIE